ncbi:hypothetical protein B0A52_04472 [Exophiala mesophila]|uniref:N-acetyltransferase domain-containing protein n=1 Tax=Exophiala mesophila TaxID=212818 RepID=A0A438N9K0_EXOME|nr:hypothetical protein B0A52_04472 [Exophiala mesophila]
MHIRPAQPTDFSAMSHVAFDAMLDDELSAFISPYRRQHPECLRLSNLRRAKIRYYSGKHLLVAILDSSDAGWDGTDRVVGYLSAIDPEARGERGSRWSDKLEVALLNLERKAVEYTFADRSVSRRNLRQFRSTVMDASDLACFSDVPRHWEIDFLAVDPKVQGRGLGRLLVNAVQKLATEDDLPVVLIASVKGRPVYRKCGFVERGEVNLGADVRGQAMVWKP